MFLNFMSGAKKFVRINTGILSTAYGVASLRVSRTVTGHEAKIVMALSQQWEENHFFPSPAPDPENGCVQP